MENQDKINEQRNIEFLENRRIQKARRARKRRITTAVLVTLILLICLAAYLVTNNQFIRGMLYHDLNQKAAVNIPVDGSFVTEYGIFKNHILSCSKNGVKAYGLNGETDWETTFSNLTTQTVSFNSPVLCTGENHCIVYDKGGKSIVKFNERSVSPVINTDYAILFAKLFDNDYIAAVTEDSGSKEQVKIFNEDGQEVFIWHSGEGNILDAALSDNGQRLVISSLDTSSGKLLDNLSFFSLTQSDPYASSEKENVLVTNLKFYNGNKNIVGISDTGVFHFDDKGEQIYSYDFSGRELSAFQYLDGGEVALVFNSNYESKYRIVVVDERGMEKGVYVTDKEILNLAYDGRNIIANVAKGFHVVNKQGKELRRQEVSKDVKTVLSGGKGKIVLVGTTEIDIVN